MSASNESKIKGESKGGAEPQDDGVLPGILRRYKAIIFMPERKVDLDKETLDRLMLDTKAIREGILHGENRIIRFPTLRWLAAAACFLVVTGVAVLYPWGKNSELVILNYSSANARMFAMRGGGTNSLKSARFSDIVKTVAESQLGKRKVAINEEGLIGNNSPMKPDSYPAAILENVTQRYALILTEVEGCFVLSLFDTRDRKYITTATFREDSAAAEIDGCVRRVIESVQK